jgi:glucosylceramidase
MDVMRNWSRNSILWNLAADPLNDPHTDNGGCSMCQGALTIDGDKVVRNIAYYTIAHASKFVRPGSVRIHSTHPFDKGVDITEDEERAEVRRATLVEHSDVLPNVAFKTPEGKIVLIIANDSWSVRNVKIPISNYLNRITHNTFYSCSIFNIIEFIFTVRMQRIGKFRFPSISNVEAILIR